MHSADPDFAERQLTKAREIAAEPWNYDTTDLEHAFRVLHCALTPTLDSNMLGWVRLLAWRLTLS